MINKDQIKTAIFENTMPSKLVRPVKKLNWNVTFCIVEKSAPKTLEDFVDLLANALNIPKYTPKENLLFLKSLSVNILNILFEKYLDFYEEWIKSLNAIIKDIVENDKQSKFEWELSKSIGIDKILHTVNYNNAQLLWIFYNTMKEKKDKNDYVIKLVDNIFDMLKPWLDKELYYKMEEVEENTRENVLFEEKTQEYVDSLDIIEEEKL